MSDLRKKVRALADLFEDWDSYGAPRFDPALIETVEQFVEWLSGRVAPSASVQIVPSSSGVIVVIWTGDDRQFAAEFMVGSL